MKTQRILVGAIALGSLFFAACGDDNESDETTTTAAAVETTVAPAGEITIANPWARTSPAGTTMGAAYMEITSSAADTLVGVAVDATIAKEAQIHEMVMAGGMSENTMAGGMSDTTMAGSGEMMMRQVEKVDLPAGTTVQLKPGGYHIMLIDLAKPLVLDQTFDVTLTFGSGATKTVTVTVRDAAP